MSKRFFTLKTLVIGLATLAVAPSVAQTTAVKVDPIATFNTPWAMTFMPDGRLLVSEKRGRLHLVEQTGKQTPIAGLPKTAAGGQGGMGDVVLHPDFAINQLIYISYVESGDDNTRGSVVLRGIRKLSGSNHPK